LVLTHTADRPVTVQVYGIVHEYVDPSARREPPVAELARLQVPRDVSLPGGRLAARLLDLADHVVERRLAPAGDDNVRALRCEQPGGLAADAAAASGDDRHLPVESAHHALL